MNKEQNNGKYKARVFTLSEMIEYQDGTIVSKTLIDTETGTVTIFAFDRGEGLSEHTAPYDAMVQILDGEAEINISGKLFTLETDQMIIMPADEPHSLHASSKFKMLLTMIKQ